MPTNWDDTSLDGSELKVGRVGAVERTTDATQTLLRSFTLLDDSAYKLKIDVIAKRESDGKLALFRQTAAARRDGGGNAVLVNPVLGNLLSLESIREDTIGMLGWTISIAANGSAIEIKVTGSNGVDITWDCDIFFHARALP